MKMAHDEDILFWELDWHSVVEHQKQLLRQKVENLSAEDFEGATLDEHAAQLTADLALEPPKIFPENINVSQREVEIGVSGNRGDYFSRPGQHYVKGTAIDVRLPFQGDKEMFRIKPTTFTKPPRGRVEREYIVFTIEGFDLTKEQVKAQIDERTNKIAKFLGFQAKSIGSFPSEIRKVAYQALEQRQNKLQADSDLIAGLGYEVRDG